MGWTWHVPICIHNCLTCPLAGLISLGELVELERHKNVGTQAVLLTSIMSK